MARVKKAGVALVTGASSGIGLELVKLFARDGYHLVLVARGADKLSAIGKELEMRTGAVATVIGADLSDPTAPPEILQRLEREGIEVDVLVNNAGYGCYGLFAGTDVVRELAMIQVNVAAPTHLIKLFLPGMLRRRRGSVLNVASTAAFQPGPLMAVNYATKAFVLSFSEALANELEGTGVTVTALCPGPTKTGFQAGAKMEDSRLVRGPWVMDAARVARAGYDGLRRGKTLVIPGLANRLLAQSVRLTPRKLVTRVVRGMQERVSVPHAAPPLAPRE
jgi:short-subunit dehydrogenase